MLPCSVDVEGEGACAVGEIRGSGIGATGLMGSCFVGGWGVDVFFVGRGHSGGWVWGWGEGGEKGEGRWLLTIREYHDLGNVNDVCEANEIRRLEVVASMYYGY